MFETFKAKICKWADITPEEFWKFLRLGGSPIDNPQALVCSASRNGDTVAYLTAEPLFVVHSYALKEGFTPPELQKAGNVIDEALVVEGKRVGIGRMLILVPENAPKQPGEKVLRYIERKLPQEIAFNSDGAAPITKRLSWSPLDWLRQVN